MLFDNRRIYFINKDFQSRFILRFVAVATIWAAATIMLFAYLAGKRLEAIRYSSHIDIKTMSELLLPVTIGVHAISFLVFAGILAFTINLLWKRLSPPLYSIKKDIVRIAGGDLASEVSLSKDEEFQRLATDLDNMRRGMREKIVRLKEQQAMLSSAADELVRSTLGGNPSLSSAATLQAAVERMKRDVQIFHY
ncbi:MAG: methyl-accepting chemotaxis protein [Nitrospirae bacterium]|nr:methyl-accepting chemotaxis protein [Nitrospirota bacterium]